MKRSTAPANSSRLGNNSTGTVAAGTSRIRPPSTVSPSSSVPASTLIPRKSASSTPRVASAGKSSARSAAPASSGSLSNRNSSSLAPAVASQPVDSFPKDRLSSTTTPVLHLIEGYLSVSELVSLSRASRLLFKEACAADQPWKYHLRQICPNGAKSNNAASSSNSAKPVKPASSASKELIPQEFFNERGLFNANGTAYFQKQVAEHCLLPSSLPRPSPLRYAVLAQLRETRALRTRKYLDLRVRNLLNHPVTKPVVETFDLKYQLFLTVSSKLNTGKRERWQRNLKCTVHQNSVVLAWKAQQSITVQQLKSIQLVGYSGTLMQAIHLSDDESSSTREWVCLRSADNEHSLSLVEWKLKSHVSSSSGTSRFEEIESDSPFAPNQHALRNQAVAAAAALTPAAAALANKKSSKTLPIPGNHLSILVGCWGPVPSKPTSHEIAFIWLVLPHPALFASMPPPLSLSPLIRECRGWEVNSDDVEQWRGMTNYTVNFSLRSLTHTLCHWVYTEVKAKIPDLQAPLPSSMRRGLIPLKLTPSAEENFSPFNKLPGIPFKTALFSGRFEKLVVLEMVLRHEYSRVMWVVCVPVTLVEVHSEASSNQVNLRMDELADSSKRYQAEYIEPGTGRVSIEITHSPSPSIRSADEGPTRLMDLNIQLEVPFIDKMFATSYVKSGCSSKSHALHSLARSEMSPLEQAEFQMQQMRLRYEEDTERPVQRNRNIQTNFTPNFTVHANQPPRLEPSAASSSSSSSSSTAAAASRRAAPRSTVASAASVSSSSSSSSSSRRRSTRPEWQDVVEKTDDDGGFKF